MTEGANYTPTQLDNSRVVVASLGGEIRHYPIKGTVDWNEVVQMYGERFRGGRLLYYAGSFEFDDSAYYQAGEVWVLAAADVDNPGRVIAECMAEEVRAANKKPLAGESPLSELAWNGYTFANYADVCDDTLLFQRGIVFAYRKQEELEHEELDDLSRYLTDSEWDQLNKFTERH